MDLWKLWGDKVANIGGVKELKNGVMEFSKEKIGQQLHLLNDKVANNGGVEELKKGVIGFLKEKVGRLHLLNDKVANNGGVEELKKGMIGFLKEKVGRTCGFLKDTLSRWARVDLTVALLSLILAFLFLCGGGGGKMMKAPGGGGRLIRRSYFESNPRAYFRNQRRR